MSATTFQDLLPSHDSSTSTSTIIQLENDQESGCTSTPRDHDSDTIKKSFFDYLRRVNSSLVRKGVSEALGTFLLMFCIGGIIGNMASMGIQAGLMEYAVTAALTVIVLAFSFGSISGAHVNPAVTIAFAAVGAFPWSMVPVYVLAQVGGSVLATYTVMLVYGIGPEIMMTRPVHGCTSAFLVEFLATFIVLFLIASLLKNPHSLGPLSGLFAGAAICLGVLITGPVSGGSMNPARSLGPALVSWRFDHLWVYLLAPTTGAISGIFTYRILRLDGWTCQPTTTLQGSTISLH